MPPKHGKRDANEREMVEAWRALGAVWIPMAQEAGFDGLLLFRGKVHIVEVKDTSQTHGKFKLTANEKLTMFMLDNVGVRYEIVWNMEQALALVEAG